MDIDKKFTKSTPCVPNIYKYELTNFIIKATKINIPIIKIVHMVHA